jgi:transcriptional regulator with XRE-family HTH domain
MQVLESWRRLGLSDEVLAGALDVDPRALARWRRGMYPQLATRRRLALMERLQIHLRDTFADDAIPEWLEADNRYLGGLKPAEALRAGRIDRVEAALTALDTGNFV